MNIYFPPSVTSQSLTLDSQLHYSNAPSPPSSPPSPQPTLPSFHHHLEFPLPYHEIPLVNFWKNSVSPNRTKYWAIPGADFR
jgi:hypothetical protein